MYISWAGYVEADIQASVDRPEAGQGGEQGLSAQELKDTCMRLVSFRRMLQSS